MHPSALVVEVQFFDKRETNPTSLTVDEKFQYALRCAVGRQFQAVRETGQGLAADSRRLVQTAVKHYVLHQELVLQELLMLRGQRVIRLPFWQLQQSQGDVKSENPVWDLRKQKPEESPSAGHGNRRIPYAARSGCA